MFLLLIMAVVMGTILAAIFSYINTNSKAEKRSNIRTESVYAAEYSFEQAYQQLNVWLNQNAGLPNLAATTAATNLTTAPTSVFTAANGYTWKAFVTVPIENGVPVVAHTDFTKPVFRFATIVEFTRTVPGMSAPAHMQFQREWDYSQIPLFQYAIFYNNNMELFPGAQFVVSGKVHSNGTIYVGSSASVTFNDDVTYVNGVVPGQYSPDDPRAQGSLNNPVYNNSAGAATPTNAKNPPGVLTADLTDTNHNNDGPRELIEVPDIHSADPNATDRMYNKAGLKILVNSTGSTVTSDSGVSIPANSVVYMTSDGTVIPSTDPLIAYFNTASGSGGAGGVVSSGSIYDYREGTTLTTTQVNVKGLNTAYTKGALPAVIPNSPTWPNTSAYPSLLQGAVIPVALRGKAMWNGILYVDDVTNSSSHRTAVQLVNGGSLPDGTVSTSPVAGLTIATDNAAYIVGDYNVGSSAPPVDTLSNSLTSANYSGTYTVQPASVMADAVTILSSNWSSSYNNGTSLSARSPSNTTINTALIAGIVQSVKTGSNAAYSGGVENYLRLLEDWSNKRLTYYGSIVNLFPSQQSTAKWITTGTYYNAPVRNWYFDTQFLNPNRLPPGTPLLRSLLRGAWSQIE